MTAGTARFFNRELSWLAFNERVLEEAADPSTPLLERIKFAAIASSNLDEFFMVRVAAVRREVEDEITTTDLAGLNPSQQLAAIRHRAHAFVATLYRLVNDELLPALGAAHISIVRVATLNEPRRLALAAFFREGVFPVLTPLAIDVSRPFPLLASLSLNLALLLEADGEEPERRLAIVQVPAGLSRLVDVSAGEGICYVLLEDVIRAQLAQLFPGQVVLESVVIRLARDAELELDDEGGNTHLEVVEREVRRRRRSDVVRLEVESSASEELLGLLRDQLDISPEDVFAVPGPLDLRVLLGLADLPGLDVLRDPPL